ncbi:Pectinesterase [Lachnellula suecica]|uniref:pectinesterase n=1 Tax=Lachnellula suecica TaxID=602035 RepID=A0A8T9CDB1_9HELO|nr:Pectinesterase [Lachnellula suecica]
MRLSLAFACLFGYTIASPLVRTRQATSQTSPPDGAVVVDGSSSPQAGSFPTVQQGVDALSNSSTTAQVLFIFPGTYEEQVYIPALQSSLTIQGHTIDSSSYEKNEVTISYNLARTTVANNDVTATVRQWNNNTKFYNVNIKNTFSPHPSTNGQNLAISAQTGNQGYYGVQFWGYQDTVLANEGNQLYAKCLIVGAVDLIFGQDATAWFENVDIRVNGNGFITASGRDSADNPSWYVINNSDVAAIDSSIPAGDSSLGRPWKAFARVVVQNTFLGDVIKAAGWDAWSSASDGNTPNSTLAEFGNTGPGSEGTRASFSKKLDEAVSFESILGSEYKSEWYVDSAYL